MDYGTKFFYLHTLGCKVNWCDSEAIAAADAARGWRRVEDPREATVCIVNTCTVTRHADASARKIIRRIRRGNPRAWIIATGCYATTDYAELDGIAEVDYVVPLEQEAGIARLMDQISSLAERTDEEESRSAVTRQPEAAEGRTRGFVKIQDGCNQFCAYCKVPYARGAPRSRPMEEIIAEVEQYAARGCKEVVLSGIHIAGYQDGERTLAEVVAAVADREIVPRLRLSSVEATGCTPELLEVFRTRPAVMPHLHIPLQSGSDTVVALMNRKVTAADFLQAAQAFLALSPRAVITTDCMVGLPGETEQDFQQTCDIIDAVPFGKVHIFPFSARPGTAAADMKRLFVAPGEIKRREQQLQVHARAAAERCRRAFYDAQFQVLVENVSAKGSEGFSENYLRVHCAERCSEPNQIIAVDMRHPGNLFIEQ